MPYLAAVRTTGPCVRTALPGRDQLMTTLTDGGAGDAIHLRSQASTQSVQRRSVVMRIDC
jgi:hypothetical protein